MLSPNNGIDKGTNLHTDVLVTSVVSMGTFISTKYKTTNLPALQVQLHQQFLKDHKQYLSFI